MDSNSNQRQAPAHLRVGFVGLGVAGAYVAAVLLLGWSPIPCFLTPLALLSLLFSAVAVFVGLVVGAKRRRSRRWMHVGVFVANLVLLYVLSIGPGNYFGLMDLRTRLSVLLTGGQKPLQAWAVGLLAQGREGMQEDGWDWWRVPKRYWSKQVRHLRPTDVAIAPVFEERRSAVCLNYGSGFFHRSIVVGPPGSRPDPNVSNSSTGDDIWHRWRDGLYDWQKP
jgi:hypothetical protein